MQTTGIDEPEQVRPPKLTSHGIWRLFVDRDGDGGETYRLFKSDEPKGQRKKRPADFPAELKLLLDERAAEFDRRKTERARTGAMLTRRRALIKGHSKLIVDEVAGTAELYDLELDPHERHDLAHEQVERVAALKQRLEEVVAALAATALPEGAGVSSEEAEEARRKIEQIGYGRH